MPTLQRYCSVIAEELGRFDVFTSSAASASADARREVIVASRIDDEVPASYYPSGWLYARSGNVIGEQARMRQNGFDGATGTFTTTRQFSDIPAADIAWEYLAVLPRIREGAIPGLREIVNEALAAIPIRDQIAMVGVANQFTYALSLPWLGEYGRIVDVLDPPIGSANPLSTWRGWRTRYDADTPLLELDQAFSTGDAFQLVVRRPAHTRIKVAGVWIDTTAGLVNDTDEAIPEENVVKVFGLWKAYSALSRLGTPQERAVWEPLMRRYAVSATQIKESWEGQYGRPLLDLGGMVGTPWAKGWTPG